MKPAMIFRQYIWIINALRSSRGLTLDELSQRWQQDGVADGNALARSSFNRHRDAILDMFGIIIDCHPKTYRYYISNPHALCDDSIERWLFSTLTVHGVLTDSASIKERVILENVPAGEQYLDTIIRAIRTSRRLHIGYRKFHAEGYERTVSPYALKLFHQRWYLLARIDDGQMRIYALDRMTAAVLTDEPFTMPPDFQPQASLCVPTAGRPTTCARCRCTTRSASWPRGRATPTSATTYVRRPTSWASCSRTVTASRCWSPWSCARKCGRCWPTVLKGIKPPRRCADSAPVALRTKIHTNRTQIIYERLFSQ